FGFAPAIIESIPLIVIRLICCPNLAPLETPGPSSGIVGSNPPRNFLFIVELRFRDLPPSCGRIGLGIWTCERGRMRAISGAMFTSVLELVGGEGAEVIAVG